MLDDLKNLFTLFGMDKPLCALHTWNLDKNGIFLCKLCGYKLKTSKDNKNEKNV